MYRTMKNPRGFLMAEMIVSFTLLGVILAGLAVSTHGFGLFNRYQWTRQRCVAAAQAQIDSIVARRTAIDPKTCTRLWPGIELSVEKIPGVDQWAGLQRIEVTAIGAAGPRKVTVQLVRYVRPDAGGRPS